MNVTEKNSGVDCVETGCMGRVAYARIAPNEDLVQAVEKICLVQGFANAFVRGGLGSLVDACLEIEAEDGRIVNGPAVEVVSLAGEVRSSDDGSPTAFLAGIVADPEGGTHGGRFVSGCNPVLATFEITLEEWLPDGVQ